MQTSEPEDFSPEPCEVECKPCGGSGREKIGATTQGEPILDNCVKRGGEGFVDK